MNGCPARVICPLCGVQEDQDLLSQHILYNHNSHVSCELCESVVAWDNLPFHLISVHSWTADSRVAQAVTPWNIRTECLMCSESFYSYDTLWNHLFHHHKLNRRAVKRATEEMIGDDSIPTVFRKMVYGERVRFPPQVFHHGESGGIFGSTGVEQSVPVTSELYVDTNNVPQGAGASHCNVENRHDKTISIRTEESDEVQWIDPTTNTQTPHQEVITEPLMNRGAESVQEPQVIVFYFS